MSLVLEPLDIPELDFGTFLGLEILIDSFYFLIRFSRVFERAGVAWGDLAAEEADVLYRSSPVVALF